MSIQVRDAVFYVCLQQMLFTPSSGVSPRVLWKSHWEPTFREWSVKFAVFCAMATSSI